MHTFSITYTWTQRAVPLAFSADEYVDISAVHLALEHFLALYTGTFTMHIATTKIPLSLDPDLSTIIDEIPAMFNALRSETSKPVEIRFYEQGSEFSLFLERQQHNITIRIAPWPTVGPNYANLPQTPFHVNATLYLAAWRHFVCAMLDALVTLEPDLATKQEYRVYREQIE